MRHGDAVKPVIAYGERPLTEKGKFEASAAGIFLRMAGEIPDIAMHSAQIRSKMTAQCVLRSTGIPDADGILVKRDDLEEDSSAEEFLTGMTHEFGGTDKTVLAVGHIPFVQRLASLLLASRPTLMGDFGKGDLLAFDSLASGKSWTLRFYVRSKLLKDFYRSYLDMRVTERQPTL
jgi:phosphohistidine phosphatase SixA